MSAQCHPRRAGLRLNPGPRHSTFDKLCFPLGGFFSPSWLLQIGVTDGVHSGEANSLKSNTLAWTETEVLWDGAKQ